MAHIPAALRRLVIERAANRCEYCGLAQVSQIATFHIDHVIPVAAGGETSVVDSWRRDLSGTASLSQTLISIGRFASRQRGLRT